MLGKLYCIVVSSCLPSLRKSNLFLWIFAYLGIKASSVWTNDDARWHCCLILLGHSVPLIINNKFNLNCVLINYFFRFGVVERVIIYKEKQSDSVDDDSDTIVKIFVEFTQMSGNLKKLIMFDKY